MAISFGPEKRKEQREKEKREKGVFIPFWLIWGLIPIIILGPIIYFIFFYQVPEKEIESRVSERMKEGLTKEDLNRMEKNFKIINKEAFKQLESSVPEFFSQSLSPSADKKGRSNPFREGG